MAGTVSQAAGRSKESLPQTMTLEPGQSTVLLAANNEVEAVCESHSWVSWLIIQIASMHEAFSPS